MPHVLNRISPGSRNPSWSTVLFCLGFVLCLLFVYCTSPWYPAAKLHVSGRISELPARLTVNWTSGHGLNGYEMYRYALQSIPIERGNGEIDISLIRTGKRHPAAAGSEVVLSRILVDGEPFSPPAASLGTSVTRKKDLLVFRKGASRLDISVTPKHHVRFEFLAYNYAGEVEVRFGRQTSRHSLYSPWDRTDWTRDSVVVVDYWLVQPDGSFAVSMDMPRYKVNELKISAKRKISDLAVRIATEKGDEFQLSNPIATPDGAVYQIDDLDAKRICYFHPHRFAFQVLFALLTAWVALALLRYAATFNGLSDMFFARERYLFWGMLLIGCFIFSLWHISFWPGITSTDSLKIWRAAHIPGMYLGDHPPLNVIMYQFLSQIWDNVAIVPIFQNILASLLISWIYFSLFRWGVPVILLAPLYMLTVFSVPLGLYTVILWKDVPFALVTVFLAFRLADLYFQRRQGAVVVSRQSWFVMLALLFMLAGLRYNGALYLVVFPILVLLLGIVRLNRKVVVLFCVSVVAIAVFFMASRHAGSSAAAYFTQQTKTYIVQMGKMMSSQFFRERGVKYLGIFDINQTAMQWDHVGNCLYGRYDNNFLRRLRWNDVYSYLPLPRAELQKKMARTAFAVYEKTYEKPWVYFSWNPWYMLLVFPVLPLFFRRLPMSAVFSLFILAEVAALVFIGIFNWRYYFFAHFASYFLIPLICADMMRKKPLQE